jgi:hypothetical protein
MRKTSSPSCWSSCRSSNGMLARTGFVDLIGSDHFYPSVRIAVAAYLTRQGKTEQVARVAQEVDQFQEMVVEVTHADAGHGDESTDGH